MKNERVISNLEAISELLGVDVDWKDSDSCMVSIDDKYTLMISFEEDVNSLVMGVKIGSSVKMSPKVINKYTLDALKRSAFGLDYFGGNIGINDSGDIYISVNIFGFGNLDDEHISEKMLQDFLNLVAGESDILNNYLSKS